MIDMPKRRSHDEFISLLAEIVGDEYTVLTKYTNSTNKVLIRHNSDMCGDHEYWVKPYKILDNRRCPKCKSSKLEKATAKTLTELRVKYIEQYKFSDCRNRLPLPFDFYLPHKKTCIECQGKQHYEPVDHFGGIKKFTLQTRLDLIKKNYCKDNGIYLLEIPYWDFKNIESILKKELGVD